MIPIFQADSSLLCSSARVTDIQQTPKGIRQAILPLGTYVETRTQSEMELTSSKKSHEAFTTKKCRALAVCYHGNQHSVSMSILSETSDGRCGRGSETTLA